MFPNTPCAFAQLTLDDTCLLITEACSSSLKCFVTKGYITQQPLCIDYKHIPIHQGSGFAELFLCSCACISSELLETKSPSKLVDCLSSSLLSIGIFICSVCSMSSWFVSSLSSSNPAWHKKQWNFLVADTSSFSAFSSAVNSHF